MVSGAAVTQLRPIALLKGAATFVPGVLRFALRGSGGTDQPRYCYSVWMRHLVSIAAAGLNADPRSIAELGPGDSLGIGLAAMLTGATTYDAFDARPHASAARNLETLDELVKLLAARAPIPDANEFPEALPRLESYAFPSHVLDDERLRRTLEPSRVDAIRRALQQLGTSVDGLRIGYAAPWYDAAVLQPEAVDFVFSQAVLEHIDDIDGTYAALNRWLRKGGVMSHSIDFKSHGLTRDWYGHWTVPSLLWRVVRGRRSYLINRLPWSAHAAALQRSGFDIVHTEFDVRVPPARTETASAFRSLSDDDLRTAGVYVIAVKA